MWDLASLYTVEQGLMLEIQTGFLFYSVRKNSFFSEKPQVLVLMPTVKRMRSTNVIENSVICFVSSILAVNVS